MSHCCHEHNHPHNHNHSQNGNSGKLLFVLFLTGFYMIAEFVGGIYSNSLALSADAGHMLADVAALTLSYFAIWMAKRPAPPEKTYGYFRVEIFAALINGIALVIISFVIIYEAYKRCFAPPEVKSYVMTIVAFGGLIVNSIGAFLLHGGSKENLNIKGAFLHIIGDLLGSVGAVVAGLLIFYKQWYLADPIISFFIAGFILYSSVNLIKSASHILMEAAPSHIDVDKIKSAISKIDNVKDVHDLHVWSISSSKISLSVHIVSACQYSEKILHDVNKLLADDFGICHCTIQIEPEDFHECGCNLIS